MLPRVAFTSFIARYREPTLKEGFIEITKVDFKASCPPTLYLAKRG